MRSIRISLSDLRAFTQVAFFIDNPHLLKDIAIIRKKHKITVPLNRELYDNELNSIGVGNISDISENTIHLTKDFDDEISTTRHKYLYPEMFNDVLKQAVIFDEITEYRTAYGTHIVNPPITPQIPQYSDKYEAYLAIIVTPYSSEKDILDAFKKCKDIHSKYVEAISPVYKNLDIDTVTNIERDREWYWQKMSGLKYRDILKSWNERCPFYNSDGLDIPRDHQCKYCSLVDQNIIEKAVSRYKSNLKS